MRALRSTWLTFRLHRFEVLFAVGLLVLTAVSAVIATSSAEVATPSLECQQEWYDTEGGIDIVPKECRREIRSFWSATETAGFVRGSAIVLPWLVGIVLGVPLVGRELETGTASMAWSLTGRRARWLLARVLPMLLLILVGAMVVAFLLGRMAGAAEPFTSTLGPGRIPELDDIGTEGIPFVTRTAAAFGVGLLAGAVVGRTMTAFVVAVVLSLTLALGLGMGLTKIVGEQVARWGEYLDDRTYNILLLGTGYRTVDGDVLDQTQIDELWDTEVCPDCGDRFAQDRAGERLLGQYREWRDETFTEVYRTVPTEAYPEFVRADVLAGLFLAGGTLLLTFPVVSRRRPR